MLIKTEDVIAVVEKINLEICNQIEGDSILEEYGSYLVVETDGVCSSVSFLGETFWYSEEDEREWIGEGEEEYLEPFEPWLRSRLQEFINGLSKLVILKPEEKPE